MNNTKPSHVAIHEIGLEEMIARLKEEHCEMRDTLAGLEEAADRADRMTATLEAAAALKDVKYILTPLMQRLELHALWEEEELIPLIESYYHLEFTPTMTTSIWVMEKDHELANEFLQAFVNAVAGFGSTPHGGTVAEAIRCLRQGCRLLREHFAIEEQTLFPYAEEMLTDVELLFS